MMDKNIVSYIDFYRLIAGMQAPRWVTDVAGKPFCTKGQETRITTIPISVRGKIFKRRRIYSLSNMAYDGPGWRETVNLKPMLGKEYNSVMTAQINGSLAHDLLSEHLNVSIFYQMLLGNNGMRKESEETDQASHKGFSYLLWTQENKEEIYVFCAAKTFKDWRLKVTKESSDKKIKVFCEILAPQEDANSEHNSVATFTMTVTW